MDANRLALAKLCLDGGYVVVLLAVLSGVYSILRPFSRALSGELVRSVRELLHVLADIRDDIREDLRSSRARRKDPPS
jgi:hypothetical protein